ncbi:hypothetical protein FG386_002179 [Cryptosporidium ryanae]|uniref:uncharacterized protein n=1 Tax=Cryptosporidium ryanae TaxID=515981 RepID=UPI00351A1DCA|nr:hypothetical protein FG386_002179 [Cryptosporidium ryanae]
MPSEDYWKIERLFMELFGTSYLENNDFPNSNRDIEIIQQVTIPTINKTFKRVLSTYNELVELSISSEKSRRINQKRSETELLFKEQFTFLIHITRIFLLLVLEINGKTNLNDHDSSLSCVRMPNLPLKLFHELLGSPGTKDCKIFLMDLAFLQGNKLLVDNLLGYLSGFSSTVQYECFNIRKELADHSGKPMNHQLLPITNNYENSQYFPYFLEREECIGIILFKVQNLLRNLWRTDKGYRDLITWWRRFNSEFIDDVRGLDLELLYCGFDREDFSYLMNSVIDKHFGEHEHWELSTLCFTTSHVLYLAEVAINENNQDVLEAVLSLNISCGTYSVDELVKESIKFSLISLMLDPANFKASWILSLLHLRDGYYFSLKRTLRFVEITLDLNPCFNDSWILYSLLLTRSDRFELLEFQPSDTAYIEICTDNSKNKMQEKSTDNEQMAFPTFIATKLISLNQYNDGLGVPLRFVRLGYKIYQILQGKLSCYDLLCTVNSEIKEMNNKLNYIIYNRYGDGLSSAGCGRSGNQSQSSICVEASASNKSKRSKGVGNNFGRTQSGVAKYGTPAASALSKNDYSVGIGEPAEAGIRQEHLSSMIIDPVLFKLQTAIWSLKLKHAFKNEGVHICCEYVKSQIEEALQLYRDLINSEQNILEEVGIQTHLREVVGRHVNSFLKSFGVYRDELDADIKLECLDEAYCPVFPSEGKESIFEVDLIDWRLLLVPAYLI